MRPIPPGWLLAAVVIATAAVYAPAVEGEFVHDDHATVAENPQLRDLGNVGRFFTDSRAFSTGPSSHTRPVLLTTFAINFALGDTATGFKIVNLALHCLNVALLFFLVRRVLRRAGYGVDAGAVAVVSAAVFALHPINTQAIAYVSSRSALLAFTFYVCALLAFVRWRAAVAAGGGLHAGKLALFVSCQVLAMLSKEHAVSSLGSVLLLEVALFQAGRERRDWRRLATVAVIAATPVAAYFAYRAAVVEAAAPPAGVAVGHRTSVVGAYHWQLATQIEAQLAYLRLFVWPTGHAVAHPFEHVRSLGDPGFLLALGLVVGALGWGLWRWWRRGCLVATGVLIYLCAMAPESLVRLNVIVNEHRFYLPAIGLVPVVAWLALRATRALAARSEALRRAAIVAGLAVLAVLGWQAHGYADTWRTECGLWARAVAVSPDDSWSQNNHGNCRLLAGDLRGAEIAYRRALELAPDNSLAVFNLSVVVEKQGRWSEALALLRRYDELTGGNNRELFAQRVRALERLSGERW